MSVLHLCVAIRLIQDALGTYMDDIPYGYFKIFVLDNIFGNYVYYFYMFNP